MDRAQTFKRNLAILAGIASLLSLAVAVFSLATTPSAYFEVGLRSAKPGFAELFYDLGRGMNAAESVSLPLRSGDSIMFYRFPLRAGKYYGLRFDPIDHSDCDMTIRDARLIDRFGHPLRDFEPADFIVENDVSQVETTTSELRVRLAETDTDPHFGLRLAGPITLNHSSVGSWFLGARMFFLCFILLCAAGSLWLLFAPRWRAAHALVLSLLVGLVCLCARVRFLAPISFDEEGFLFNGWLVNNGSVPYRDFFEAKPPVIFFANALGLAVFGLEGFLFRIIPTAIAVSSIFFFYLAMIKRRVVPWLAGLLAAQVALWLLGGDFHDTGLNDSETYGFALTLLGFSFVSLSDGRPGSPGKVALQVLGGICFGLAVLSKELFVLSVIPAWLMAARLAKTAKWDWRRLMFPAAGGLVIGLIFVTYLATHSAFLRYLDLLRFYRTFAANYCIDIGRFPKVSGLAVLLPSWSMLHERLYNLNHLAFVLSLGSAFLLFLWRRPRGTGRWIDVAIVTLAVVLGMIAVSVGHCFWRHYFLMGMTGLILLSVAGAEAVSGYLAERRPGLSVTMAIVLSGLFIYVAEGPLRTALAAKSAPNSGPNIPQIVAETIEKHSKPGDYVLMTESPLVYIVMNRKSSLPIAFFLDDILPYDPTLQIEALRERLAEHLPKVCYFGNSSSARQTMFRRLLFEPLLAEHYYVKVRDDLWYLPDDVTDKLPEGY